MTQWFIHLTFKWEVDDSNLSPTPMNIGRIFICWLLTLSPAAPAAPSLPCEPYETRRFENKIQNERVCEFNSEWYHLTRKWGRVNEKERFRTTFTRISFKNEIQDGYNSTRKLLMQRVYWNSHNWQKLSSSFGKNIQLSGVGEYR